MKLSLAPFLLLAGAAAADSVFRPHRVSLSDLSSSSSLSSLSDSAGEALLEALQTHGIIAIKDLSSTYSADKGRALSALHDCASAPEDKITKATTFSDGTVRRTLASRTVPGPGGMQKIKIQKDEAGGSAVCEGFVEAATPLRETVDAATRAFADRLGYLLGADKKRPLLSTEDGSHDFVSFGDIAEAGEHLEHFHAYQRPAATAGKNIRKLANDADGEKLDTIELHTDQGLFIVFTPGMLAASGELSPSSGFYVQDPSSSGGRSLAQFEPDDLIVMLGDGVEQIGINDRLKAGGKKPIRSVPHAMVMPDNDGVDATTGASSSRVWHGRMVLPPSGAVHPSHADKTFGDVRRSLIESSLDSASAFTSASTSRKLGLGCSSPVEAARILADEEVTCADDTTYCWHRCMPHEESGVSVEFCAKSDLPVKCINPREQVYVSGHGDFYPACSNSTMTITDYPLLPGSPRDENRCDAAAWNEFSKTEGYEHVFDSLGDNRGNRGWWDGAETKGQGKVAKFMWTVAEDGKTIDAKLVFNGIMGWLAVGPALDGGRHNGMNGASIFMAIPGGDYSQKFGLDIEIEDNVNEYQIDVDGSSFRHWPEPLNNTSNDASSYSFESTDCFTSVSFNTDNIGGVKLVNETDGKGDLVWASNTRDYHVGYHGRGEGQERGGGDRDRFVVDWTTGEGYFPLEREAKEQAEKELKDNEGLEEPESDNTDNEDTGVDSKSSATGMASDIGMVVLGLVLTANLAGDIM